MRRCFHAVLPSIDTGDARYDPDMPTRFLCTALFALVSGCSVFAPAEPESIIIRNGTDRVLFDLQVVAVDEDTGVQRRATYSGVPPRSDQYIRRRPGAPSLPEVVEVSWRERRGPSSTRRIRIADALAKSGGRNGDTIVLEVRSGGGIGIFLAEDSDRDD